MHVLFWGRCCPHVRVRIDNSDHPLASRFSLLSFDVLWNFTVTKWWSLPVLLVKSSILTLWEKPPGAARRMHPWWFMQWNCNQGGILDDEVMKLCWKYHPHTAYLSSALIFHCQDIYSIINIRSSVKTHQIRQWSAVKVSGSHLLLK